MEKRGFAGLSECEEVNVPTLFQPIDEIRKFLCTGNDVVLFWENRTAGFKTSHLRIFCFTVVVAEALAPHPRLRVVLQYEKQSLNKTRCFLTYLSALMLPQVLKVLEIDSDGAAGTRNCSSAALSKSKRSIV